MLLSNDFTVEDLRSFIEQVTYMYEDLGISAAIGLPFLETLFPILPLFLMIAFNILLYGTFKGYLYTYIGTLVGTIFIFLFMRYVVIKLFGKQLEHSSRFKKAMRWIEHTHPMLHILVLSIPFSPTFMINYSMGLTNMKFSRFLLITLISRGLLLVICIPFGKTLVNYYNNGLSGGVTVVWLSITGLIVLGSIIIGQRTGKSLKRA